MTPLFSSRRGAAEFASAVDGTAEGDVAERYADLLATVGTLRSQERPEPRPEFVANLRSQLLLEADTVLVRQQGQDREDAEITRLLTLPQRRTTHRRERRFGAAAAALVLVGATAGMAAAAQGALPGDPLYPIKRAVEQAEVHLNTNDSGKGSDMLGQASTRLTEVNTMVSDSKDPAQVNKTLSDFSKSAGQGADLLFVSYKRDGNTKDIAQVRQFAADQMAALQDLASDQPDGLAAKAFAKAADTLADIDQQARVLCADCGTTGPLSLPSDLITLTSSKTLNTLLSAPAEKAQAAQVAAAEEALKRLQNSGKASLGATGAAPEGTQAPPGSPLAGAADSPLGQVGGLVDSAGVPLPKVRDTVKKTTAPVKQLVEGVTGTTAGLGDVLNQTLNGVTGLLK